MSHPPSDDPKRQQPADGRAQEQAQRSGEGAQTALQALIRQRKRAENPHGSESEPPATTPPPPTQS